MKWNFFREVGRKAMHLLILVVISLYLFLQSTYGKPLALLALCAILILLLILDYLRIEFEFKIAFIDFLTRPKEINRMHGAVYFMTSFILCFAIFDFPIALAAVLMATFGDMFAAIFGQRFGHMVLFKKKTVVGGAIELFVNVIVGLLVLLPHTNVYTVLVMAFGATLAEIFVDTLDDNFTVPLIAGFLGQLFLLL